MDFAGEWHDLSQCDWLWDMAAIGEGDVETHDSLLMFSSERLDLWLEEEVIDMESNVGNGEDKDLNGEQEDLARYELCGLQCGG
jgi:hypothetical protein